jgi:hypothetical protein
MTFVTAYYDGWSDGATGRGVAVDHVNHWRNNLAKALDGTAGGSYYPVGPISVTDGSGGAFNDIDVHGEVSSGRAAASAWRTIWQTGTLTNATRQTLGVTSGGQILRFQAAAGAVEHELTNTGAEAGDWIMFVHTSASVGNCDLHQDGAAGGGWLPATVIVTLAGGAHAAAIIQHDGLDWRLADYSLNCTPGLAA